MAESNAVASEERSSIPSDDPEIARWCVALNVTPKKLADTIRRAGFGARTGEKAPPR
jgi:hypothetical protein